LHHTVQPGETVAGIARHYGVPYEDVVRANRLRDPQRIVVGRRLVIPGATGDVAQAPAAGGGHIMPIGFAPTAARDGTSFQWPVPGGAVTSPFGKRDSGHHDGIDVQAPIGTAVRAARDGEVLYSGSLRGYGNLVIVDHGGGFATIYAAQPAQSRTGRRAGADRADDRAARRHRPGEWSASPFRGAQAERRPRSSLVLPPMTVASRRTQGEP
jgi:murein DD-endopeptidase MepM/ murein hydrolase activator NlpD